MPMIVTLTDPAAQHLELTGGKATNLAVLIAAGFRVPSGFCVTVEGYQAAAEAAGLDPIVAAGGPELAERARAALLATPVPDTVAAEVRAAYLTLSGALSGSGGPARVAVRSSATAEDLPTASFAGQQDTFLGVLGADAVLDAVRRCWASLWTDRAVDYRAEHGIDPRTVRLAVVVQLMIEAEAAGVLFTADPGSGRRTRSVIDAAPGLGEAVVSGAVNPDHVVVDADGTIAEYRAGDKTVAIRSAADGGTERAAGSGTARALADDQVAELVALGRRVADRFGAPQDIEWAIDPDGRFWLTQSRPITTLFPLLPERAAGAPAWFCFTLAQGLVRPITPIGLAAFRIIAAGAAQEVFDIRADRLSGPAVLATTSGRLFVDVGPALRHPIGRAAATRMLTLMESRSAAVLRELAADPAFAVSPAARRPAARIRVVRRAARAMWRLRVPPVVALTLASPRLGRRYVDRLGRPVRALTVAPDGTPAAERLDHVVDAVGSTFPLVPRTFPAWVPGLLTFRIAQWVAGAAFAAGAPDGAADQGVGSRTSAAADEVLRSLPHNVTTEMDLGLWRLAVRARRDPASAAAFAGTPPAELAVAYAAGELPHVLQLGLARFLDRYGHRAVAEIDLGMPRWSDDPTHVLGVLANYQRLTDPELAPDTVFARGGHAAEAAVRRIVAAVASRSRPRALLVGWLLRRGRALAGMRETPKDYAVRVLAYARRELAVLGRELVAAGRLAAVDDVYFLDLTELRAAISNDHSTAEGIDLRAVVAERRAAYETELRRRHVPRILLADGTEAETLLTPVGGTAAGDLVGTPASAGTVTAPARVILDPVGARLEPGEVLVAPSTDPGWTPLFLTAGGLVMEMGGPNSHGAVVAREYGIPAVVGVPDATRRLHTGQQVTVDGAAGLVRPEVPADTAADT